MTNNPLSTILGHEPANHNPDLIRILFDNRDPLEVPISTWVDFGLKDGLPVIPEVMLELEEAAALSKWEVRALSYISFKPRTKSEVIRYLTRKGATVEAAELVTEKLRQHGYLSDKDYALMFVQSYEKRASRKEIAWRLGQRGVRQEDVSEALGDPEVYEGELEAAILIAKKTLRSGKQSDMQTIRQRIWNRLQRKGFSVETARMAMDRVMSEIESIAHSDFLDND
ncbi:regulatory protein RecX [Alicyclobacillus mengziensis]|uniref:Regulatory protein RecX n=1 Tax=Alicyclobacillus mengziensis TaxID=2931921 RepID=A0A9X7Z4I7_9BACL|nr:RecX family transcriptional regulator [Alicyclobacillus mengziensis]QSO45407.1 RecX family transcriptional regulator [Alicyclobacillus mengziensis]